MRKWVLLSAAVFGVPSAGTVAYAARPGAETSAEPHLVTLSDVQVPIIDAGQIQGRLHFEVVLDSADEAGAVRVAANLPRLRSVSLATGIEFSRLYVSGGMPVNAEQLAGVLTKSLLTADPDIGRVLVTKVQATMG